MQTLSRFLRAHKDEILEAWIADAARLPSAHGQPTEMIRNHIPEIVDRLAETIEREDATARPLKGLPNLHAALRASEGYDLRQVVAEYRMLRKVILEQYERSEAWVSGEARGLAALRLLNGAIDAAIADAVDQYALEREKAREMFLGILGHDLRDPLNAVSMGAQLLQRRHETLDPQAHRIAERIATSADRMSRLIQDMLDLARSRLGGGLPISPAPVDARALVANAVGEIAQAHPERTITCQARSSPGDFSVRWDGDRVAQAVANLLSNAITYGTDPIVVTLEDQQDWITIAVHSRGEVPEEALPTLFVPFARPRGERRQQDESPAPKRRRGSLGLGLYIVREIAAAHAGRVQAESANGGTILRLVLPREAQRRRSDER